MKNELWMAGWSIKDGWMDGLWMNVELMMDGGWWMDDG
jgi:hypothetical protein